MAALSDFNAPVEKPKLSDFFATGRAPKPVLNPASINNIAAYGSSLVSGEQIEKTYNQITEDLNYGTSDIVRRVLNEFDDKDQEANYNSLVDIAADSSLSPDERTLAIKNFSPPGSNRIARSFYERTAMAASMAESEADDNDENDFVRVDATKRINQVDEYNGWVQKQINAADNLSNPETADQIKNVIELFIPFLEQSTAARISGELFGEDGEMNTGSMAQALVLFGDNKDAIRSAILAAPLDQRRAIAEQVVNLVKNTSGPTAFNPNDIIMMEQLDSFLRTGVYGDDNKFMDNLFSVLDSTIVLSPLTKGVKAVVKGATGFSKAAVDTARLARYEAAVKALDAPDVAKGIDEVVTQVVPNTPVDDVIQNLTILDEAPADMIADTRKVLTDAFNSSDDVSIDAIIGQMRILDNLPSDKIAEVRQSITSFVGNKNKELDAAINDDTLQATRDLISDKVIAKLESLDDAPYEVYSEVRRVVDEKVNASTIGSKTIAQEVLDDVNAILTKRKLAALEGKEAGTVKSFITTNVQESNIRRRRVRTGVQPTSISQAYKDSNPAKARTAHQAVVNDKSGRAAEILYGTTRTDAIANDVLPEVASEAGSVRNKVKMDEGTPAPDKYIVDQLRDARGDIHFDAKEKASMRNAAKDVWRDVQGLVPRREMSTIGDTDRGVSFDVVYGPKDGGFSEPSQALEQAKFGLRKYGVTEDQIEVLGKNAQGEYVPVDDFSKKGDYLIRVKHDYEFSPADTVNWTLTSSNKFWRMFDTLAMGGSGRSGGLAQHVIPSTAVVDRLLLDAASVASDRTAWLAKRLLELGNNYAKNYKELDATQKVMVDDYIVSANAKSLKFNTSAIKALGINDKGVETLRAWKKVNDTLWHFENLDLNKTLRARGYMKYVDQFNHTDLILKPIAINQTGDVTRVFNGEKIVRLTREDIRKVYEQGGTIARTRGAVEFEDDAFEFVIVDNNSASSYLRAIRDEEPTLNYRDGYYTVRYQDPYFITKEVKGKDGTVYTKAIATAGDRKMADAALARLRSTDEKGVYSLRGDIKKGTDAHRDREWESMVSGGRTSQRVRGQRLQNFNETEADLNKLHIESPEESLVNSIRSLSNRVAHRDFVQTAKQRFINQFGDLLESPKGVPMWPEDVRNIGVNNLEVSKSRLKDARATWRYIEAIDSGYVNLLDDFSKNFFKGFSDTMGRREGWSWLEKGGRAAEKVNPTAFARKKAFRLLLASNPLRQLPVQAMQALPVILATNPLAIPRIANQFILLNYMARGGDVESFVKGIAKHATGLTTKEAKDLVKNYERSGFEASVQAHSLIRDDMKSLVDRSLMQKVGSASAKPLDFLQKIGFEAGENLLMRSVWLSEYDMLRSAKKGKDISMSELETLNAKVRHLTLNMNKAGELPYNENAFSALMQFFQAPHKAFSQIVMGHKGLTTSERLRLGSAYVLAFGIGGSPITSMLSNLLPDNGDNVVMDVLQGGVFNILVNKALSSVFQQPVNTDFADSFRLLQMPTFQFFIDIMNMQIGEAMTAFPSASLVFGDSPRITTFVKSLARPFTVNNERKPAEFMKVGEKFLMVFSGGSNFFRAKYALEHLKTASASGGTVDYEVGQVEAILKAAGFSTMDEVKYYALNDKTYTASQAFKDDIKMVVDETSRELMLEGIDNSQQEYIIDMMAEAQRIYGNDPIALKEFQSQFEYKAGKGEFTIFKTLESLAGKVSEDEMRDMIKIAPIPQEQKDVLTDMIRMMNEGE